jgi:ADP-ribose pyrophosphatase YjhB (NUDIX family)
MDTLLHRLKEAFKPSLLWLWRRLPGRVQGWAAWLLLPKFLVGSMAVTFDDAGRVLLFYHTYRDDYPWGLPGGWIKVGENPMRAVEREVFEESGYRVKTQHPLVIGGDKDLRRLDLIFLCDLEGGDFRPSAEVSDADFFPPAALPGRVEPFHVHVVAYAAALRRGERGGVRPPPPASRDLG